MRCRLRFGSPRLWGIVLLAPLFLNGCATTDFIFSGVPVDSYRKEIENRNLWQVDAGPEVALSSADFNVYGYVNEGSSVDGQLESIVDSSGTAHLAGIDSSGQIHHISVGSTGPSHDEVIGTLPKTVDRHNAALAIVEYPAGTLRIAAGDAEYTRLIASGEWTKTGGNRCRRYLVRASSLYCAFVAAGEEVGTAPRTDVNFGLILILPVVWPSSVQPGKLVLAERVDASWVVRTVIDPATDWSADETDVQMGVDKRDMVHVVFGARRGRTVCTLLPGGRIDFTGCGDVSYSVMRYARFALTAGSLQGGARKDWQEVQSEGIGTQDGNDSLAVTTASEKETNARVSVPYRLHVGFAPNSGVAVTLVSLGTLTAAVWGTNILGTKAYESLAVDVEFFGGKNVLLRISSDDVQHFLAGTCELDFWLHPVDCALVYKRRTEDGKLATTVFKDTGSKGLLQVGGLAIGNRNMVLVIWFTRGKGLVGRWISPRLTAKETRP